MSTFSRILVPVVFSARCQDAMRYAAALACRYQASLTLLHVFTQPWAAFSSPEGYATPPPYDLESTLEQVKAQLEGFLCDELEHLRVTREVLEGDPAFVIAEYARANHCGLIVMPTHGYGPFRRFLLGSVTAKVLHDAPCPVFTGPHMEHPPALESPRFRKILCAVNLCPEARHVMQFAFQLAADFDAELLVAHALPAYPAHLDGVYFDTNWYADLAANARTQIVSLAEELHVNSEIRIEIGEVPAAVRMAADSMGADLMVIGRGHRHGALGRLRTNAYAILRESRCPVVAV